ncbi:MAG: ATP synthase F1 subunit delta [Anaerovoracaceae bacterium]|jgi:F-type H+-transporting ATPase subunit delta
MAELKDKKKESKAIKENASEVNDSILEEMKYIGSLLREEQEFHELLRTPTISSDEKKEMIRNVFEGRISAETYEFLKMYIDFQHIVEEELKISAGIVYSVEPLTEDQLSSFEKNTGRLINKRVKLANKLDPSLLGGVKIIVDDKIIDASIRKRLQDLEGSIKRI